MMMMMMMMMMIIIIIIIIIRQYSSNVPYKLEIKELQITATLGIAQILREVLM